MFVAIQINNLTTGVPRIYFRAEIIPVQPDSDNADVGSLELYFKRIVIYL